MQERIDSEPKLEKLVQSIEDLRQIYIEAWIRSGYKQAILEGYFSQSIIYLSLLDEKTQEQVTKTLVIRILEKLPSLRGSLEKIPYQAAMGMILALFLLVAVTGTVTSQDIELDTVEGSPVQIDEALTTLVAPAASGNVPVEHLVDWRNRVEAAFGVQLNELESYLLTSHGYVLVEDYARFVEQYLSYKQYCSANNYSVALDGIIYGGNRIILRGIGCGDDIQSGRIGLVAQDDLSAINEQIRLLQTHGSIPNMQIDPDPFVGSYMSLTNHVVLPRTGASGQVYNFGAIGLGSGDRPEPIDAVLDLDIKQVSFSGSRYQDEQIEKILNGLYPCVFMVQEPMAQRSVDVSFDVFVHFRQYTVYMCIFEGDEGSYYVPGRSTPSEVPAYLRNYPNIEQILEIAGNSIEITPYANRIVVDVEGLGLYEILRESSDSRIDSRIVVISRPQYRSLVIAILAIVSILGLGSFAANRVIKRRDKIGKIIKGLNINIPELPSFKSDPWNTFSQYFEENSTIPVSRIDQLLALHRWARWFKNEYTNLDEEEKADLLSRVAQTDLELILTIGKLEKHSLMSKKNGAYNPLYAKLLAYFEELARSDQEQANNVLNDLLDSDTIFSNLNVGNLSFSSEYLRWKRANDADPKPSHTKKLKERDAINRTMTFEYDDIWQAINNQLPNTFSIPKKQKGKLQTLLNRIAREAKTPRELTRMLNNYAQGNYPIYIEDNHFDASSGTINAENNELYAWKTILVCEYNGGTNAKVRLALYATDTQLDAEVLGVESLVIDEQKEVTRNEAFQERVRIALEIIEEMLSPSGAIMDHADLEKLSEILQMVSAQEQFKIALTEAVAKNRDGFLEVLDDYQVVLSDSQIVDRLLKLIIDFKKTWDIHNYKAWSQEAANPMQMVHRLDTFTSGPEFVEFICGDKDRVGRRARFGHYIAVIKNQQGQHCYIYRAMLEKNDH